MLLKFKYLIFIIGMFLINIDKTVTGQYNLNIFTCFKLFYIKDNYNYERLFIKYN